MGNLFYAFLPDGSTLINQEAEGVKDIYPPETILVRMDRKFDRYSPFHIKKRAADWSMTHEYGRGTIDKYLLPAHKAFLFLLGIDPSHDPYKDEFFEVPAD